MPHFTLHPWLSQATPFAAIVAGVLLLFFGRRLFWLFVAVIGFMAGWYFAVGSWHPSSPGDRLILAVLAGLVGLVLAIVAQKIAVALAGFYVGFHVVASLLGWHVNTLHPAQLLVLAVAGVIAAVLALMLFDFALIGLSAIAGAGLILDNVPVLMSSDVRIMALVLLAICGAAVQAQLLKRYPVRRRV